MRIATIALLGILVAGCGSKDAADPAGGTTGSTATTTPATTTPATTPPNVDTSKFSMTIPSEWIPLDFDKMDAAAIKAKLKGTMFEIRAADLEKMRPVISFFAFDKENSKPAMFANLNVVMVPSQGSAKEILTLNATEMKKADPASTELKGFTTLPDSITLQYSMYGMSMIGVITVQKGNQIVLTYTAPKGTDAEKMKKIVQPIANSFKLK